MRNYAPSHGAAIHRPRPLALTLPPVTRQPGLVAGSPDRYTPPVAVPPGRRGVGHLKQARIARLGRSWRVTCAGLLAAATAASASEGDDAQATRAAMARIFESMRVLLPLSVDGEAFASPEHRAQIEGALRQLRQNAALVGHHAGGRADEFRFLGRSLERDALEALERFEHGRYEAAAFLVRDATENCIACHARLPSPGDSPLAEHFVESTALRSLPPEERAKLQIATRRFDDALVTLEALIASPGSHPAELLLPVTDYLTVAIRVKGDPKRPVPVLERFAARPDLWRHLRIDVLQWIRSLRDLEEELTAEPSLARGRRLIDEAKHVIRFPADRGALVHYVVASSVLERYLAAGPASDRDAAEASYLLGLALSRIETGFWISQADFLLENAIRRAPREPFAESAYALLEEEVVLAYSGSAGVNIPPEVEARLTELRRLIDEP